MISVVVPLGPGRESDAINSLRKQKEKVEIIIERGTNTSKNRNLGAKKSKSEIVAFVNGHTTMPSDWSRKIRKFFNEHEEIDIVGGPQHTANTDSRFGKISGYALASKFGAAGASDRYGGQKIILNADEMSLTSANLAVRKKVLEKILFDEHIYPGEDPKFIADCKKEGFVIAYDPDIIVYNKRRGDWKALAEQIFSYGRVRPKKESFIETLKKPAFLVPSAFLIYLVLFAPFAIIHWFFLLPGFFYIFLNLIFSVYECAKRKDFAAVFTLIFIYFIIHVSYGLGFITGSLMKK